MSATSTPSLVSVIARRQFGGHESCGSSRAGSPGIDADERRDVLGETLRSVLEHLEVKPDQSLGVDQEVELSDLPVLDRERANRERLARPFSTTPAAPLARP